MKEDHPMSTNKKIVTLMLVAVVGLAFTGCSDDSSSVTAPTVDTAPPAVPADMSLQYSGGSATVTWAANTVDQDLAGFVVVRQHDGQSLALVQAPVMATSFVDAYPPVGTNVYHVYAVDLSGNQSALASAYLTVTKAHETYRKSI
jgi:hypothetical protein